jgi:tetratricopeptide (TPR) repeat protein
VANNNYGKRGLSQADASAVHHGGALHHVFVACFQLLVLALLYAQTHTFDYVYFDDAEYVLENPAVLSGLTFDGLNWAFTSFYMSNWHPLTWLSHMLDITLFGPEPGWAHIHNAILHGINSLLVYALLLRYCGSWGKAFALSLVFLVHPLHVESVAWIAERKDLLCAVFYLLGLILYDHYRARPGALRYALVLLAFTLSLLAKPMAVTFPAVLLVLDFFIYRRCFSTGPEVGGSDKVDYLRAIAEKIPFLALSAVSSAVTISAQDAGNSLAYIEAHSLTSRWIIATGAYVTYLRQMLMPVELVAFYPIAESHSLSSLILPGLLLVTLLVAALAFTRALPLIPAGLCFFLVTLLPVIGLIQVGSQAHADRYMYLPSVGLLMAGTCLLPSRQSRHFRLAAALTAIFVTYLSVICYWQVGYWRNQHTLFARDLEVVGPNFQAHLHLAKDYLQRGMLEEARQHGLATIDLRPDVSDGYQAIGNIALAEQHFGEAEKYYRLALERGPVLANVVNNLGIALAEQGDLPAAIKAFEAALEVQPDMAEAQQNLRTYGSRLQREKAP